MAFCVPILMDEKSEVTGLIVVHTSDGPVGEDSAERQPPHPNYD